jgi:hypothetical protein
MSIFFSPLLLFIEHLFILSLSSFFYSFFSHYLFLTYATFTTFSSFLVSRVWKCGYIYVFKKLNFLIKN